MEKRLFLLNSWKLSAYFLLEVAANYPDVSKELWWRKQSFNLLSFSLQRQIKKKKIILYFYTHNNNIVSLLQTFWEPILQIKTEATNLSFPGNKII